MISTVEYLVYMMKVKETGTGNSLFHSVVQNYRIKSYTLIEKKILKRNYDDFKSETQGEKLDIEKIDEIVQQGRHRASLSVMIQPGTHLQALRRRSTKPKAPMGFLVANR